MLLRDGCVLPRVKKKRRVRPPTLPRAIQSGGNLSVSATLLNRQFSAQSPCIRTRGREGVAPASGIVEWRAEDAAVDQFPQELPRVRDMPPQAIKAMHNDPQFRRTLCPAANVDCERKSQDFFRRITIRKI
jgi:hypothetical protein